MSHYLETQGTDVQSTVNEKLCKSLSDLVLRPKLTLSLMSISLSLSPHGYVGVDNDVVFRPFKYSNGKEGEESEENHTIFLNCKWQS